MMAQAPQTITVDVKCGPLLPAICDLLSAAQEAVDVIPDFYPERDALLEKTKALHKVVSAELDQIKSR